jgi:membrane protease YdiL (CAAX protease family)
MTRTAPLAGAAVVLALVVAALVLPLRPIVLVGLGAGALVAPRRSVVSWACAAGLPVALVLAWGAVVGNLARTDLVDCANPASPAAIARVVEALVVGGLVVLLAGRLVVDLGSLGLRRPGRLEVLLGVLAVAVIPAASLLLGSLFAEPFFGSIRLHISDPLAIVPAAMLAIANGTMEELVYRGSLMAWLTPLLGAAGALVGQALVFGAAHTGGDYTGPALPVVLVVGAGGLIAGLIVRRTGSLFLPIVVHACFDIPLYYYVACRVV